MVASYGSNPDFSQVDIIVEVPNLLLAGLRRLDCDLMVTNIAAFETSEGTGDVMIVQIVRATQLGRRTG